MLRIAMIGCGAITEDLHLPAATLCPDCKITALVDSDVNRSRRLADMFAIPHTGTEMANVADEVDAVIIATPPHVRVDVVQDACRFGLPMLIEKPLANTVSECDTMIRMAQSANLILATAHIYRFWPARIQLQQMLNSGDFGRPVQAMFTQGKPYSWQSVTGYTVRREMVPGGVLLNAGTHPLDTILWWFGDPVRIDYRDDALGGLESNFLLNLYYSQGLEVQLRQSRTTSLKDAIRVETDRGTIQLATYARDYFEWRSTSGTSRIDCPSATALRPEQQHLAAAVDQLSDFARAVTTGSAPRVDGPEGRRVISVIDECYRMKRARPLPQQVPLPGVVW